MRVRFVTSNRSLNNHSMSCIYDRSKGAVTFMKMEEEINENQHTSKRKRRKRKRFWLMMLRGTKDRIQPQNKKSIDDVSPDGRGVLFSGD